ncbi:hypothetical protein CDD81_5417 [Ophiocordyceps australis]|uniref:Uncharacterized protein n=1 Tax=Ophiocordyceps australis TaxID=1399860 RepID=A0A2C5Y8U9_9HYPO|nr:hypothetical protein CDD81_5417 [Ophiocordyceps australis]
MEAHSVVYISFPEDGQQSPSFLRSQGGIDQNEPTAQDSRGLEWWFNSILPLYADWTVAAYGSHDGQPTGANDRRWVYRIAGAPHLVLEFPTTLPAGERDYAAISGVFWSQVQAWARTAGDGQTAELVWHDNPDYDSRWEDFGVNGVQESLSCAVPGRDRDFDANACRQQVRQFMNELLSPQNTLLDAGRLQTLRELYDWNPETEPDRDFPLIRQRQPDSLVTVALRQINWAAVPIPAELQLSLAAGLVTASECAAAVRAISQAYRKGSKRRRATQNNPPSCNELVTKIKETPELNKVHNKPPPCQKIKDLEFGLALSSDYWSGSFDRVGAALDGPAGKVNIPLADAPSLGFNTSWIRIDLKSAFGQDTIDIKGLSRINLTAQGIFANSWLPYKNDQFQVQDIKLRAKCVEDGFKVNDDRFVALNAWYGHSKNGFFLSPFNTETVASLDIAPGDWHMTPPCSKIKSLDYKFSLGNGWVAGTSDSISFALGVSKRIVIGNNFYRETTTPGSVNLREAFGSNHVDIRNVNKLEMFDAGSDKWQFQGIAFEAACAEGNGRMTMERYGKVDAWINPSGTQDSLWKGEIGIEDWQEVA